MVEFSDRTKLAIKLAKEAGCEIKRIKNEQELFTKEKELNDVVTVADEISEKIIIDGIGKQFPNDTIIAEESGICFSFDSEFSWAIDPLDGTMNYSRNIPYYCVSVGYMKDGVPEGGAIYIPEFDEIYVCEKGKGAYCNNERISASNIGDMRKSLITIGFNNRYPEVVQWFNDVHGNAMNKMLNVEKLFSTAISLCYVASGKVETHFELYCFLWDICVGALLVNEAGGKTTTLLNRRIDFSQVEKQIIIATNDNIHDSFSKMLGDIKNNS